MMHMEHRMVQTQSQRLMLTQKMQQAIQILQLNRLELEQYVGQELETNPVLEHDRSKAETETPAESAEKQDSNEDPFDDISFDLDDFAGRWGERIKEGQDLSYNPSNFAKRPPRRPRGRSPNCRFPVG